MSEFVRLYLALGLGLWMLYCIMCGIADLPTALRKDAWPGAIFICGCCSLILTLVILTALGFSAVFGWGWQ